MITTKLSAIQNWSLGC